MKIGIDIRSTLKKNMTGIGFYTRGLVRALSSIDEDNFYYLYSYIRPFDLKRSKGRLPGKNFRHRVDRMSFKPERTMTDVDVFHTSSYDIPARPSYRMVTTVHDLVPLFYPEGYSESYIRNFEETLHRALVSSSVVVADSFNTKNDIENRFKETGCRVEVIYPGIDNSFNDFGKKTALSRIRKDLAVENGYIFYSGGMGPRKNLPRLLEAFHHLKTRDKVPHKMVISGTEERRATDMREKIAKWRLQGEVIFAGYVDREMLHYLYSAADVFVYPSLYEGFGLPILEAFSCGCPVVTSNTSSCAEVGGEAALKVDPLDPEAISDALLRAIKDKDLAIQLAVKGKERAKEFSWRRSAERFLELFELA